MSNGNDSGVGNNDNAGNNGGDGPAAMAEEDAIGVLMVVEERRERLEVHVLYCCCGRSK